MSDEEHSRPGAPPGLDEHPQILIGKSVQTLIGLIEEKQFGGGELGQGEVELLLSSSRQGAHGLSAVGSPAQTLQDPVAGGDRMGPTRAVGCPEQAQVFVDGEQRSQSVELGCVTESVGALDAAGSRMQQSGADLEESGLSRPVGPDHGDDLTASDRQVEIR